MGYKFYLVYRFTITTARRINSVYEPRGVEKILFAVGQWRLVAQAMCL